MRLPSKTIKLGGGQPLALIYSDAAAAETSAITIGWVILQPGCPPRAGAGEVPSSIFVASNSTLDTLKSSWEKSSQHSAVHSCAHAFRGHRV